jgi:hypothetical protein
VKAGALPGLCRLAHRDTYETKYESHLPTRRFFFPVGSNRDSLVTRELSICYMRSFSSTYLGLIHPTPQSWLQPENGTAEASRFKRVRDFYAMNYVYVRVCHVFFLTTFICGIVDTPRQTILGRAQAVMTRLQI